MRKTGICPKCSHTQLVYVSGVADTGEYASHIREMFLAMVHTGEGFFGENLQRAGKLSAMMCRGCGYTEFYVLDPQSVQPDGKYITELTGPTPFR